jgi:putative inorganic carbon (hco3(-)) transporter
MGGSDIYIAMVYAAFMIMGLTTPFAFTLGYLWVDTAYPQFISTVVNLVPSSLIMGSGAIVGYLVLDRRYPPRLSAHTVLTLLFAGWCTLSILWAEMPDQAWFKWDWAFKTIGTDRGGNSGAAVRCRHAHDSRWRQDLTLRQRLRTAPRHH